MTRLVDTVDGVIGVDTHRDTLAAAAADRVGGTLAQTAVAADLGGYQRLLEFGRAQVPGRRCWAVEGAGSYGAGLTAFLQTAASGWWRSAGPSGRRGAPGPRATPLTRSGRLGRRLSTISPWRRVVVATGKRCGCC